MKDSIQKERKKYSHLNYYERLYIERLRRSGYSYRCIAQDIERSPSSIARECHRNTKGVRYNADTAEKCYKKRIKQVKEYRTPGLKNETIRNYVMEKLKAGLTPEQIAGRLPIEYPTLKTNYESIYQYIYKERKELCKYLVRSHKKRKRRVSGKGKRSPIPNRVDVDERGNIEGIFGHWESDLIIGSGTKALLSIAEKKSKITYIKLLKNKKSSDVKEAILSCLKELPVSMRKSITYDNGTENVLHEEINEVLGTKSYFCKPYHSWEKGFIENTTGLIRRYLPKGTNFDKLSENYINTIVSTLNNRPRKALGYRTPLECLSVALLH